MQSKAAGGAVRKIDFGLWNTSIASRYMGGKGMPYTRKKLKSMFTVADGMVKLLGGDKIDELPSVVEHYVETSLDYLRMAIANMEVEAGRHGMEERERVQQFLPGFESDLELSKEQDNLTNKQ